MVPEGTKLKMTPEVMKKLEESAALDCSNAEMAAYANISHQTLLNWLREDENLRTRIEDLRQRPMLKARNTIVKSLDNPRDAQWYAERKAKREFGNNIDLTTGGKELKSGVTIFTSEEIAKKAKELDEAVRNEIYAEKQ